ncbi:ribosome assembly RNA-binding protein YhbY [Ampullimonas aquatilis]|uniref:ribosome assembly RNA-binding protein YhbY n=1 Tax=Ampullimonas aquatilis TaxID=1341549 RepID=UPI003C783B47
MSTPTLTPAQRSELRSQAHSLKPVVMIGGDGLTEAVLKEIDLALSSHQLIKVRVFSDDRDERNTIQEQVCLKLNAAPVQHIGKLLVLFRPEHAPAVFKREILGEPKRRKAAGLRTVTVVKPSRTGTRRPSVKKVSLKATERVTAGGFIKRAKNRQVSVKKKQSD